MPFLQASQISYQFDNGDTLFHSITCSMTQRRVGLVGRNGVGKSLLAELLSGERQPSTGSVALPNSVAIYRQLPSELLSGTRSIGEFLGKQTILDALSSTGLNRVIALNIGLISWGMSGICPRSSTNSWPACTCHKNRPFYAPS